MVIIKITTITSLWHLLHCIGIYEELGQEISQQYLNNHQSLGACLIFWLKAERRAWGGNTGEGVEEVGVGLEDGGRKGGGGKESGEKGN